VRRPARWSGGRLVWSVILRGTWGAQALVIGLGLLLPPLAVVPLDLLRRVIDEAIPTGDRDLLLVLALIYLGAVLARAGVKFAVIWLRGWIAEIVMRVLRVALIRARRSAGPQTGIGGLGAATSVMAGEVEPIGNFAAEALNTPLIQGGTLLAVFGFMLASEPALAAIGIAALLSEAAITPVLQHWINMLTYRRIRALRRAGHGLIAASRPEDRRALIDSLHQVRRAYRLRLRMNLLKAGLKVSRNLIDNIAEIAVLAVGASMVAAGTTELGIVVAFLAALRRVREPWSELVGFYRRLTDARVKYRLIHAQLRLPGAMPGRSQGSARSTQTSR